MKTRIFPFARRLALLGVLAGFAGVIPWVQAAPDDLKHSDKSFIEKAAKSGLEERSISQVAADRAVNPQVKDFAQMMVTDHARANAELTALAAVKGVKLPEKEMAAKWLTKDAKDFDHDYVEKMVEDHEEAVKLFSKEAGDGKDADTVAFARKTLPTLQHHLEQAKDLKKMLK